MKTKSLHVLAAVMASACVSMAQAVPGTPEENGLNPKGPTVFLNLPSVHNNENSESLGIAVSGTGNVIVGWEDDGDGITDMESVWTILDPIGGYVTPETDQTSLLPDYTGQVVRNRFLSYFRADGTATSGRTSWGPKIKADPWGNNVGMGATSFELGVDVEAFAEIQNDAGGGGDFPSVQLLTGTGSPLGIVSGVSDANAETAGDIRIGDWDFLKTGNIVIVGESRQNDDLTEKFGGAAPLRHAAYRVVTPAGVEVKAYSLVSEFTEKVEMWHGVGVTANGFAVRFAQNGAGTVRLFDNAGNPTSTNINLAEATGYALAGAGGRGDSVGFHGNGKDAYVVATSGTDANGPQVWVTVINANGTIRYSKPAITDVVLTNPGRLDAAIDASGRVVVAFTDAGFTGQHIVLGRVLKADGSPESGTFWVSELESPETFASYSAENPRVAWRDGLVAFTWLSKNSPEVSLVSGEVVQVVAVRLFGTFRPGSAEGVGLTRIVKDTPLIIPAGNALGNWEPNASVIGTSTFLIEGNTFTVEDGVTSDSMQRYVVAIQPAAGGTMRLGDAFHGDDGKPFQGQINYSRQNGNPGRVAGDKRPGAKNFVVGGEASPHLVEQFQSDGRWTLGFDRLGDGRYGTVQAYSLDTTTLAQTPLHKALDSANGRLTEGAAPGNQIGRFGGDLAFLDNGNYVAMVQDNSRVRNPDGNASVATIFAPDGTVVTESFKIANGDIWCNLAAYKGGFAVRAGGVIYFFDNAGVATGTADQSTSGAAFDRGRGDGTRLFGHINSPYVYLAGKLTTGAIVQVAAWDSRDKSFVAVSDVSEASFAGNADRVNGAVDALNRLTVSWVSLPAGYIKQQVAARVFQLDGVAKTFKPLTPSFLAFINASNGDTIRSVGMTVAMTTKQIMIAAKGEINRDNKPDEGANTPNEVNFYTVLSHPVPAEDPTPIATSKQTKPALAQDSGVAPLGGTVYVNPPNSTLNNDNSEALGVAVLSNGNVVVSWEDDGDDLGDQEAVWTIFSPSGVSLTPLTTITTIDPNFAGQSIQSRFLSYFRTDGSAISGRTSWGPKIKGNLFGAGFGMGATSFDLGLEIPEFAAINNNAAGENAGDFPAVQLLSNDGAAKGIVSGLSDDYAERDGDVRIGDWDYLSNGNLVIVGESRQRDDLVNLYGGAGPANHGLVAIVKPDGTEVKPIQLLSSAPVKVEIWHGTAVTANGFAVRYAAEGRAKLRLFTNAGDPVGAELDAATVTGSEISAGGGRGEGVGFHGNGKDAYVLATAGAGEIWVAVLNADGTKRWAHTLSGDTGLPHGAVGRVDAAIDASGRVAVVYTDTAATAAVGGTASLTLGRLFDATGAPIGGVFQVSETELPTAEVLATSNARVDWRGNTLSVIWLSKNQLADNPDAKQVIAMRTFNVPGGVVVVTPTVSVASNGDGSLNITFTGTLQESSTVNGSYSAVAGAVSPLKVTPGAGSGAKFYRATAGQ